jgi:hypothetical protein
MHPPSSKKRFVGRPWRLGTAVWCLVAVVALAGPVSAGAQTSLEDVDTDPPPAPAHVAQPDDQHTQIAGASVPTWKIWEYALLGTAIAGIATGVTLVTVNHARVGDYNIGVKAYDEGVDANAATYQLLADLRSSINTGERWGYIVGGVGLAAAFGAAYLYVTGDAPSQPTARIALGLDRLIVYGRF